LRLCRTIQEVRDYRDKVQGRVALVPTMGYLHEGHLSLVRRAREENDVVFVSVFVNPTQFGPNEDFARYPRDMQRDLALLEAEKVDAVFAPDSGEMYVEGFSTYVEVEGLSSSFEGAIRPRHFRGVATVVSKLFNIIRPDYAYFGQKDAQQAAVLRRMVKDLNLDVTIVPCPIIREEDGLAASSRNIYLGEEERKAAVLLYQALLAGLQLWQGGEKNPEVITGKMKEVMQHPLISLDYAAVVCEDDFSLVNEATEKDLLIIAAKVGTTRLIDNMHLLSKGRGGVAVTL
jgi:pantoate--beta-alanine ligase